MKCEEMNGKERRRKEKKRKEMKGKERKEKKRSESLLLFAFFVFSFRCFRACVRERKRTNEASRSCSYSFTAASARERTLSWNEPTR